MRLLLEKLLADNSRVNCANSILVIVAAQVLLSALSSPSSPSSLCVHLAQLISDLIILYILAAFILFSNPYCVLISFVSGRFCRATAAVYSTDSVVTSGGGGVETEGKKKRLQDRMNKKGNKIYNLKKKKEKQFSTCTRYAVRRLSL